MDIPLELLSLAGAALALVIALGSLWISWKTAHQERENDFYQRRREILFKLMETRTLYSQVETLASEARTLRDQLREQGEALVKDDTIHNYSNRDVLDSLEQTVRKLNISTPASVLENAADDVQKMYVLTVNQIRRLTEIIISIRDVRH